MTIIRIPKLSFLTLLTATTALAQGFSVGVIGGVPFSDVAKDSIVGAVQSIPKSNNFTVGPAFQVNLPFRLRIEVDALFRPYDLDLVFSPTNTIQVRGQQWRFPAMVQYRFGGGLIRPFVGGGVSFAHLSGLASAISTTVTSGPGQILHHTDASPVLGAGIDVKIPLIRLSGEFRYTRHSVSNISQFSNLNQAEFLLGIHF